MLIFGPYSAVPSGEDFAIFNLSSPTEAVPRLPGLLVAPQNLTMVEFFGGADQFEKNFDMWYYNYVIEDPVACSSLMSILLALYNGNKVYVCIGEYSTADMISIVNESFMKFLQARYDINYSVINSASDLEYIPKDGCDFMSVAGIMTFDQDRNTFMKLIEEQRLANGGVIDAESDF